ncbi:MAG: collagenase [Gammaproteobacteria bacterium]|nr:collagenase [Gammaproteobacteria bacterium]
MLRTITLLLVLMTSLNSWSTIYHDEQNKLTIGKSLNRFTNGLQPSKPAGLAQNAGKDILSESRETVPNSRIHAKAPIKACDLNEAVAIPDVELADYLIGLEQTCVSEFFYGDADLLSDFYTSDRIILIAEELVSRTTNYAIEHADILDRLLSILRAGYYNRYYDSELYSWDEFTPEVRAATLSVLNKFYESDVFWTLNDESHANAVFEWFLLIDVSESRVEFIPMFKQLLTRFNESFLQQYRWTNVYNSFFYTMLERGLHRERFRAAIEDDNELIGLLEVAANRNWLSTVEDGDYEYLIYNTFFYIGKMHGFDIFINQTEKLINKLLEEEQRFSYLWMSVATSINGWSDCNQFSAYNICKEAVKPELEQRLFPNTFKFDDGKMVVRTALELNKVESLYYAAKQVQAQFFRLTENDQPLPDDKNDTLTMVIYDSPNSYDLYQYFLNGIDTDNGGIYIEQDGTFYTYDRTEQDSIYSLEELFRHEYTHYLQARFSIHGVFGETVFYENNRITWLNEGSAEYLAHSTQYDGVLQRNIIVSQIANDSTRLSISEVVNSGYSGGFKFYRYGALLVDFLNKHHNEKITSIFDAIRNNNVDSFDALIDSIANSSELEAEFQVFIDDAIANLESLNNPSTLYIPARSLEFDSLTTVEELLVNQTSLTDAACTEYASSLEKRIRCTGKLETESPNAKELFNQELDETIQYLVEQSNDFDWYNLVCWFGDIALVNDDYSTTYTCETSIRPNGTERENILPLVSINHLDYIYDDYVNTLSATVIDFDSSSLTFEWKQLSGPTLVISNPNILEPNVVALESLLGHSNAELELTVSDGVGSISVSKSFNVYGYNSEPVLNAGSDRQVYYGDTIELIAEASDPEDQDLSYRWEYYGDIDLDLGSNSSARLSFTIPDGEQETSLTFVVYVSDGEREVSDNVQVTVSKPTDLEAPVITLKGQASITITLGDTFVDPGATATDNNDGDLSESIIVTGIVDTNVTGEYILTYQVSDDAGNAASPVTRTVIVKAKKKSGGSIYYTLVLLLAGVKLRRRNA